MAAWKVMIIMSKNGNKCSIFPGAFFKNGALPFASRTLLVLVEISPDIGFFALSTSRFCLKSPKSSLDFVPFYIILLKERERDIPEGETITTMRMEQNKIMMKQI